MKHYKRHYITHHKTLTEQSTKTCEFIQKLPATETKNKTKKQ